MRRWTTTVPITWRRQCGTRAKRKEDCMEKTERETRARVMFVPCVYMRVHAWFSGAHIMRDRLSHVNGGMHCAHSTITNKLIIVFSFSILIYVL